MTTPEPNEFAPPTIDALKQYSDIIGASWGVFTDLIPPAARIHDAQTGLVIDVTPYRDNQWLVRTWIVTEYEPPALNSVAARILSTFRTSRILEERDTFTLSAAVVIADRPTNPDDATLMRTDYRGQWAPTRPAADLFARIIKHARTATGRSN